MSYTGDTQQPTDMKVGKFTCRSYKPFQQALDPQAVFSSVTAPLCTEEILGDRRYLATQVAKELDDETKVTALAGQEQTLLRQRDCECAFCHWVKLDFVFALLVHLKAILLLRSASLPQLEAYARAKNLLMAGSSWDLGPGSWPCQEPFENTKEYPLTSPSPSVLRRVSSFSQAYHSSMVPVPLQPA